MFGKILMLDLYKCKKGVCDDLELHYRFLEELVERLGMQKLCQPVCLHAPVKFENGKRIEIYPDKTGVSAWIGLITSLRPADWNLKKIFNCCVPQTTS